MRRPVFATSSAAARALFARSHHAHLAATLPSGEPVLRALHAVVHRDWLAFHAAPVGEKIEIVGRAAVVQATEVVCQLPSYFEDPERACPATTLYRSAQAHGVIEELTELDDKTAVLQLLMDQFQPEGGYAPLDPAAPLYTKAIAGLFVGAIRLDQVDGKAKLLQHRSPASRAKVLAALWQRGAPGDAEAIEAIRGANPGDEVPDFLRGPGGTTLAVAPGPGDAEAAVALVRDAYWNVDVDEACLARALRGSTAWVGARDAEGRLIATARALGDGAKCGGVYDVMVGEAHRGRGLGTALVRLLLDHPAVRGVRTLSLGTRDARSFYARFGFVPASQVARGFDSTPLVRVTPAPRASGARARGSAA